MTKDIGAEDQPTPVAAQTVFAATRTTKSSGNGFKWLLGSLCTIAFLAFIVSKFLWETPLNRTTVSPEVAAGIEKLVAPVEQSLTINNESLSGTLLNEPTSLLADETTQESIPANDEPGLEAVENPEQMPKEEPLITELDEETDSIEAASLAEESDVLSEQTEEFAALQENEPRGLPAKISPEPSLIKITRSKKQEDRGQSLKEAYSAYQNGNYDEAKAKYEAALKEFPNNRDALLGLGALASKEGDYNSAYLHYAHLLSINPRDEWAKVAIINLQDESSLLDSESAVNSMLHDNPEAHVLHFTLGNIYASSSRWAEAQQAFFDAYRLNSGSSDYALNLAVSLDHIGQKESALDYYVAALELADSTDLKFDTSQVKKRIGDLNREVGR